MASCSGLVFFLLARLRVSSAPHAIQEAVSGGKVTLEDALRLLTLPRFFLGAGLLRHRHLYLRVYDQQFPVYFSSQFPTLQEGNAMYGYLNSFQVFLEATGMFRTVAG